MRRTLWTMAAILCDIAPGDTGNSGGALALTAEQLQSITGPIITQVQATVTQSVTELRAENKKLSDRIEELAKPITQSGWLRGAPGIRTGEDPLSSRPYRFQNIMGLQTGAYSADRCKVELDVSQRLRKHYVQKGGMSLESDNSFLVPFGMSMLEDIDTEDAVFIQQSMLQSLVGFDPDRYRAMIVQQGMQQGMSYTQALSQFDDTGLGVFLGPTQKGDLIELVRAKEFLSRAGARQITLPANGRLKFDRHTGACTAYWIGEVPDDRDEPKIPSSRPKTGGMDLIAKKLATLVKCPNDLLRFTSPETEAFFRMDMAKVMALEIDKAGLESTGSTNKPKGLINFNILSHVAATVGTDGNTFGPKDVNRMKALVEEADHDTEGSKWSWGMRPLMWNNIIDCRADAVTAGDQKGPFLFSVNRADVNNAIRPMLSGDNVYKTTQISRTRSKGSSNNLSYIIGGLFENLMIARAGVLEFASTNSGDTPFQTDQTWFRAIQHCDIGVRYEDSFVICDQLSLASVG